MMRPVVDALLPMLADTSGIEPQCPGAAPDVEVIVRDDNDKQLWFFLNHSEKTVTVANAPAGENLITGKPSDGNLTLPRNAIAVIRR
jgi:beta-galactosidase GanA